MQQQVQIFVGNFFLKGIDLHHFFELLEETEAWVVGGVPHRIMADPSFRHLYEHHPPKEMDILIPSLSNFSTKHWTRFLKGTGGYRCPIFFGPHYPHHHTASLYYRLPNEVCLGLLLDSQILIQQKTGHVIKIFMSKKKTVIPLFLQSTNTSNFFVLTHSQLHNFYPSLTRRQINITSSTWCNGHERDSKYFCGLRSHFSTIKWEEPCDAACLIEPRFTKGMVRIGTARWGGFDGTFDLGDGMDFISIGSNIESTNYMWRLGEWCCNSHCPNYRRRINLLY